MIDNVNKTIGLNRFYCRAESLEPMETDTSAKNTYIEFSTTVVRYSVPHQENGIEVQTNVFDEEEVIKVVVNGSITTCTLQDGSKGVAKCSSSNKYDISTGIKIAYNRAKIKQMKKELEKLTK